MMSACAKQIGEDRTFPIKVSRFSYYPNTGHVFCSYSSVDYGTKKGDRKLFKQKHFHPEGEATSCPLKTSARPF